MELSWHGITATPKKPSKKAVADKSLSHSGEIDIGLLTHEDFILNNVDGLAVPGEVLAIMGASGSGKTSLLNILAHRGPSTFKTSGSVRINGFEIDKPTLRKVSAFAQQKDLLIGTMTVIEHLRFMAALRTSSNYNADEQEEKVQKIMAELGLSHIANTIIGWPHRLKGISGGERKRVSLASEILSNPSILFCDEPTSGLDAFFTNHVIQVLKDLARRENMTILVTIHQPSSKVYGMFDKLCLLAMGQVIYLGPPNEVYTIFGSAGFPVPEFTNPAEHVIQCLSLNDGDTTEDHRERIQKIRFIYTNSAIAKTYDARLMGSISEGRKNRGIEPAKNTPRYAASWCTQLGQLVKRSFKNMIRDPLLMRVRLSHVLITSVIIGIVYFNTKLRDETILTHRGILFNAARDMNFMFMMPSVAVFTDELPLLIRENHANIYRVDAYFLAKNIAELPQYVALPILYSTIVFFATRVMQVNWFVQFPVFTLICIVMANMALSIGYAAACIFGSTSLAIQTLPLFAIPMMVYGGFFINLDSIPTWLRPLSYLSWYKYTMEAHMINMWTNIESIPGCNMSQAAKNLATCAANGKEILRINGFKTDYIYCFVNIAILITMSLFYRLLALLGLFVRTRIRRG